MILPGWNCAECFSFNGEEKEPRNECRSCGKPRKTFTIPLQTLVSYIQLLEENLRKAQESGTALHERIVKFQTTRPIPCMPYANLKNVEDAAKEVGKTGDLYIANEAIGAMARELLEWRTKDV